MKKKKKAAAKKKKTKTKLKRVLVWVEGGIANAKMDKGVEWELIDWDNIRCGADAWTHEEIDALEKWGKGLVSPLCLQMLRTYARRANNAKPAN